MPEQERARRRKVYAALVEAHQGRLLRAALRLCAGNEDQAQDMVQETFIKGYEAFLKGQFIEGTNARAWFLRILTNHFLAGLRRRKWQAEMDIETLTAGGEAGPEAMQAGLQDRPEAALMATIMEEPLERALASLPEALRVCVILVDIEEMEYAEAAAALGIPIGTVRSRLSRARQQLQEQLQSYARNARKVGRE